MTAVGQIIFSQEITSFYLITFLMCLIFPMPIDITCISTLSWPTWPQRQPSPWDASVQNKPGERIQIEVFEVRVALNSVSTSSGFQLVQVFKIESRIVICCVKGFFYCSSLTRDTVLHEHESSLVPNPDDGVVTGWLVRLQKRQSERGKAHSTDYLYSYQGWCKLQ